MGILGFGSKEDKEVLEKKKAGWDLASSKIKTWMFVVAIVAEIAIIVAVAKSYGLLGEGVPLGSKIAVIDFNQEVTQEYVNTVIKSMDKVKKDKAYKEILFIMNSPGGSPTASEELSEYLRDYNKNKKIHMYVQAIAASGGYYIASAIKPLISNKNAMVGSIGVIMPHYNIGPLAEKLGVEEDDLSAGEFKKPITFFKKLGEKEKAYLKKQILTPTYNNFITSVALNRELSKSKIIPFAEGKIYIANDPSIQGILIDEISVLHKLKKRIKTDLKKKVSFVDIMPKEPLNLLGGKVKFDIKVDTGLGGGLR
jgi:protease-4